MDITRMTHTLHKVMVSIASAGTIIGGLLVVTDAAALGLEAADLQIVGGWLALLSGVFAGVATVLRANWIPGVETGVAKDV